MDRITVAEAADRLGVTRDAVRKRIKRSSIEWDAGPNGEVFVYVDASATSNAASATNGDGSEDASGHEPSAALVESLQDQVAYLRHEVEIWQDEARRKDHLLAAALERIPAIEAPPDTPPTNTPPEPRERSEHPSEERGDTDTPSGKEKFPQQQRSWVSRFFFGA